MSWQLTNQLASFAYGAGVCELDPTRPDEFMRIRASDAHRLPWDAFAIHPLPRHAMLPTEVYVRDNDLIASFAQSADDNFAFQLNWRGLTPDAPFVAGIELWISVQTNLLDIHPEVEIAWVNGQDVRPYTATPQATRQPAGTMA